MKSIHRMPRSIRALAKTTVFILKVYPMLPSGPIDWVTDEPLIERVIYPTCSGQAEGEVYRPSSNGPHPGVVVCLGVVPFGVDHPQVPVLGRALARAGVAALLYWSPAMRDFRLDQQDIDNIPLAYDWLIQQPYVDPARSSLIGTCVGGAFALMAASRPLIRHKVSCIFAYAPYSSMWTFARDIVAATRSIGEKREPWRVDPLTRKVFAHSLTAWLEPGEAGRLRAAYLDGKESIDRGSLSNEGQSVYALLTAQDERAAEDALRGLPLPYQAKLTAMSPLEYLQDIQAPLIIQLHDVGDQVIPVSESRQLYAALSGNHGVEYTEMQFSHLDPAKGKLPLFRLLRELGKMFRAVYRIFWQVRA